MRTFHRSFLFSMLLLVCGINTSKAQWVQTGAISVGYNYPTVNALLVTHRAPGDTDLFAGTSGGIFHSTNDGVSWSLMYYFGAVSPGTVTAFAVSDTNIFAGGSGGVYLSTNNCTSWTLVDSGLTNVSVTSLVVSGTTIFASVMPGTANISTPPYIVQIPGGVYRSTNNGTTWSAVNSGFTDTSATQVTALGVSGSYLFAGTQDGSGIFRSSNNGTTWTSMSNGLLKSTYDTTQYIWVYAFAVSGSNIFAGTASGVVPFTAARIGKMDLTQPAPGSPDGFILVFTDEFTIGHIVGDSELIAAKRIKKRRRSAAQLASDSYGDFLGLNSLPPARHGG